MKIESKGFELSDRLVATFTLSDRGIDCKFYPALPARFTASEASRYREARAEMLQRLAVRVGADRPIPGRIVTA